MEVVRGTGSTAALVPIWNEAVGPSIAKNATPTALYGDVLVVQVTNAQWAEALQQREAEIVARLDGVKHLRLEVRG
jgi:predicted nucleic acid-binding Zn ribbon protein